MGKTVMDPSFEVTPRHREWALKKGYPLNLPDVFVFSFVEHFAESEVKHRDWNRTFYRWIRQSSPSGDFYRPSFWERKINEAKQMESDKFKRTELPAYYDPEHKKTPMPTNTRQLLESMRVKLGS